MLRTHARKPRWWLVVVQVVLLLATTLAPTGASAAPEPMTGSQLIQLLQSYNVIKGDDRGNLNLDKPITRAEMITIMVRALGKDSDADLYRSFNVFSDAKGHWAEGYVAYAFTRRLVLGDGNGLVRPNDPINWAEALTLVLRVVGQEPAGGQWPTNIILAAADLKLVPEGVMLATIKEPATRGLVFQSLSKAIVTVPAADGKTFLQANLDNQPPVISLSSLAETTKDAQVRVSGTVQGANQVVVNGQAVMANGGAFAADVALTYGPNKITVTATDLASNTAKQEVTVSRLHPVATLEIAGPDKVRPSGTATYLVSAKDSSGKALSLDGVTAKVEGNIGTYDLATGQFTAGTTPGKGRITVSAGQVSKSIAIEVMGQNANAARLSIRSTNDGRAVSYTKPMTIVVEVQDAMGVALNTDYGRQVTLTATGMPGLTVSPAVAYTDGGIATFTVRATSMGWVSLQAASGTLIADTRGAEFGSNLRVRLSADPGSLVVGGSTSLSRIRANLVDENGNAATNQTANDIVVQLSISGSDGSLIDSIIRIPRSASSSASSGDDGMFAVGALTGTVYVSGTVTSGQNITVDSASIGISVPSIGSGSFWDVIGSYQLTKDTQNSLMLRLSDASGSTIPGAYALQISLNTTNNEPKIDGIPVDAELYVGNTKVTKADTVIRTSGGVVPIKLTYKRPGQVMLTVTSAASNSAALGADGVFGVGVNSGVSSRTFTFTVGGTIGGVKLLAESDALGDGQTSAAGSSSSGRPITLKAFVTDASGNWVPGTTGTVTLTHTGTSTTEPTNLTASVNDGKATFTIYPTATEGTDTYSISGRIGATTYTGNSVEILVQKTAPAQPVILAARGVNNGVPGGLNYLDPADTGLELELGTDPSQKWVIVRVYTENSYSPIFSSSPIDISLPAPRVVIPKSSLPTGVTRYQVVIRNGYGESPRSVSSPQITNSVLVSNISITGAKLQRSTNTLVVYGSNFNTGDTINPALIRLYDASTAQNRTLAGAQVTGISYGQITLNVTNATALADIENPALFSGSDVTIKADAGWYARANGEKSSAITTNGPVTPMAHVTHVEYDRANSRLYLVGVGFNGISINFNKARLVADGVTPIQLTGYSSYRTSDTLWTVPLDNATVQQLDTNAALKLTLDDDWAYESNWSQTKLENLNTYARISVTSVAYDATNKKLTLTGSGFTGGSVTVANLRVTDLSTAKTRPLSGTAEITGDTTITITMDTDVLATRTEFTGDDVYLTAMPAWLTQAGGRSAAEIPERTLRLPTVNP